jgi:hypothetical protein
MVAHINLDDNLTEFYKQSLPYHANALLYYVFTKAL